MNGGNGNSRRRCSSPSWMVSEASPLEIDHRSGRSNSTADYATFSSNNGATHQTAPFWWVLLQCITPSSSSSFHSRRKDVPYKLSAGLVLLFSFIAYCWLHKDNTQPHVYNMRPEWDWDRNVFLNRDQNIRNATDSSPQLAQDTRLPFPSIHRNLLLVQTTGSPVLDAVADITSRPVRAYAKQWGRDYLRYSRYSSSSQEGGRHSHKDETCLDKVAVLQSIMEQQARDRSSIHSDWDQSQQQQQHTQYDAIALLPADAVVRDLDYDLLQLLPDEKLVAITGFQSDDPWAVASSGDQVDVVLFNLRHEHAGQVVRAWSDLLQSKRVKCGKNGNDLSRLLHAVESVFGPTEDLSLLVSGLEGNEQGFVGNADNAYAIKALAPTTAASSGGKVGLSLSNLAKVEVSLQTAADSVCYRYFPKCEVL